jgi:phage terminase Nu1 subunit (DNA packaging protein)
METMASSGAAAAHIFIGIARFRELIEQGVITKQAPGEYDLDVVRREAFEHLRRGKGGHGTADLSKERSSLAHEQTLAARFKNAVMRGDYVSLEELAKKIDVLVTVVRERILSIPGKVSDTLVGRFDREEIDLIIREELHEALNELSNPAADRIGSDRRPPSEMPPTPPAAA